ncbi:M48 family metallopeptidase [Aestuariivita boseongensis]|uniref:M48 family metallopeptidase n=1 Tax=Aestuariivita boseongensis TaxID=1470562 RepID=UPI0006813708|nr:SprT family zinc-dependent metalloprotease [Aestuariivita boseongensis]
MAEHVINGDPPVKVHLRQSGRARRISLRVSRLDGKVTLTHPRGVSQKEALAFAYERADWLRGHVAGVPDVVPVALGAVIPVEGAMVQVIPGRRVGLDGGELTVNGRPEQAARRVASFLKTLARDRLAEASDHYAERLGQRFERISLRDTRSRWGSCSSRGTLMYSWRLIMAPPQVLRYVAAHEVAHLAEMNHSQAFWDGVTRIHGPYATPRRWLREHGQDLHRYQF